MRVLTNCRFLARSIPVCVLLAAPLPAFCQSAAQPRSSVPQTKESTVSPASRPVSADANKGETLAAPNTFYPGNRAPLRPSPFVKLPIGAIKPRGWLRTQLTLEADGFSGRLAEISEFLRRDNNAWLSKTGAGEHGWEEVPYWLKGFGDLGYVLGDQRIIDEARVWIEGVLGSQRPDGYFGPEANLQNRDAHGKADLWPNMIMLNALQSYYEYTQDKRVLEFMTKYFKWELDYPEEDFLLPFWQQQRAADNLASVYWLYNLTGEKWLLELAEKIHRRGANWTDMVANWHGVNIAQAFRGPEVYFQQSGDETHRQAAEERYQDVMCTYGLVPGGGFGADENCRKGFTGPRQGTETCTWAELMLSFEQLLRIDGDAKWADRCEEIAFNSLPASMTADLKALHYLTAPNLVACDRQNHASGRNGPGFENPGDMLGFNPHAYRCCQHNIAHAWPYFAEHLWLATPGNGLAAVMYAPCEVRAQVGDGTEIRIAEETKYPFDDTIRFTVRTPKTVTFPLMLRVPAWSGTPDVERVTGAPPWDIKVTQGFVTLSRKWQDGDTIALRLPMELKAHTWGQSTGQHGACAIRRGPLTYSLKIGEKQVPYDGTKDPALNKKWPAIEILPTTPWNYALVLSFADMDHWRDAFKLVTKAWDGTTQPFNADSAPLELQIKARRLPEWQIDPACGLVGDVPNSPAISTEPDETITLIPMGCARLRITAFPRIVPGSQGSAATQSGAATPK